MEERNIKDEIPKLFQKQFIDYIMYGFICGARQTDPEMTIEKASSLVQEYFGLEEDKLSAGTIRTMFYRTQAQIKSYRADFKTEPFYLKPD